MVLSISNLSSILRTSDVCINMMMRFMISSDRMVVGKNIPRGESSLPGIPGRFDAFSQDIQKYLFHASTELFPKYFVPPSRILGME